MLPLAYLNVGFFLPITCAVFSADKTFIPTGALGINTFLPFGINVLPLGICTNSAPLPSFTRALPPLWPSVPFAYGVQLVNLFEEPNSCKIQFAPLSNLFTGTAEAITAFFHISTKAVDKLSPELLKASPIFLGNSDTFCTISSIFLFTKVVIDSIPLALLRELNKLSILPKSLILEILL